MQKYNISLSVQTAFIDWRQEPDEYLKEILGARSKRLNPIKTFSENGIRLSAGSDAPCTTPDPINWMYKACNHSCAEEALSVKDALRMCTYNGYLATFDEKDRGSLETGKSPIWQFSPKIPILSPRKDSEKSKLRSFFSAERLTKVQSRRYLRILCAV